MLLPLLASDCVLRAAISIPARLAALGKAMQRVDGDDRKTDYEWLRVRVPLPSRMRVEQTSSAMTTRPCQCTHSLTVVVVALPPQWPHAHAEAAARAAWVSLFLENTRSCARGLV